MSTDIASLRETVAQLEAARAWWERTTPAEASRLLRTLAEVLLAHEQDLLDIAVQETHLTREKLQGEVTRTVRQLQMFADIGEAGAFWEVVVDHADPASTPPRPELRKVMRPLGVVGVFAASNFPFAFGILGGDVASALAARCPVLVRAHPAQPLLGQRLAELVTELFADQNLPTVLAVVTGDDLALGRAVVEHEHVSAIGFTGSRRGGLALAALAASRPVPIPVYAEMGSSNPLIITPGALRDDPWGLVDRLALSLQLGHGQLCTKPGVVAVPESPGGDTFVNALRERLAAAAPQRLLHDGMRQAVADRVAADRKDTRTELLLDGVSAASTSLSFSLSSLALTDALQRSGALEEVFGPYALILRYRQPEDLARLLAAGSGELTVSVHVAADELDRPWLRELAERAAERAGRIVWNGMPTGVLPVNAMHHGGPFPATTDGVHTAVGAGAVRRFLRPVTYQDAPADLLPAAARESNPWGVPQLVDHQWASPPLRTAG
jgi:NADP-dependent aldehyde dehydrogenase